MIKRILSGAAPALTLLTLALSTTPAWAEKFYKWVDEEGVTHYSIHAPVNAEAETLKIETPKPAEDEEADSPTSEGPEDETVSEDGNTSDKAELSPEELAKIRREEKANCDKAQKNLYTLKNRTRIVAPDEESGGKRYLSDDERAQWIADSKKVVDEFCR